MRRRIDHLEGLVKKLLQERDIPPTANHVVHTPAESPNAEPGSTDSGVGSASDVERAGKTVIDGVHSVYHGGDDWGAVLQEINELKNTWNQAKEQDDLGEDSVLPPVPHTVDGSGLLFNQVKPIERIEILATLPQKPEVDRLISFFFDHQTFPITVPPILHEPTFMREYEAHWKDPSQTNLIWLGLLFSMLGITMVAYHQYGEPGPYEGISESLFQLYRLRTGQCLLSGDMAKCLPYTVETLRFNATAELNRKDDNRRGLWMMTGVIMRAAINMGYHRDPSHNMEALGPDGGLSVLKAEYRRRIWLSVVSMDDMTSFNGGFPRMMSAVFADTQEPRNLHDWELTEATTELPPSRSLEEKTATTYLIVKGRMLKAVGRVADFNSTPTPGSYETALEIDQAVNDAYMLFPEHMKVTATSGIRGTTGKVHFSNLSLLTLYHRAVCALHCKFMFRAGTDSRFRFSRERCIESALAILAFQHSLEPSFYLFSQTRHIFTVAAMVLFMELALRRKHPDVGGELAPGPTTDALLQTLEMSCAHWAEVGGVCSEAPKIHKFLADMLSGIRNGTGIAVEAVAPQMMPLEGLEASAIPGLDMPFNGLGIFSSGMNFPSMDFDWSMWDTFVVD